MQSIFRTTQTYARITNKKIEHDMEQFADKLGKFNTAMGIGEKAGNKCNH